EGVIAGLRERGDKEAADAVERANSERAARGASSAWPAWRIASSGAGLPVISSTWAAAWCRSRAKPLATIAPAAAAASARGVGQGWYTTSMTAIGWVRENRVRSEKRL